MSIYNLNPRRVVWFSPNEPSNKYDIWLSRNAHLDENGEPTTDSNSQRDCDYIFKIYDCGKWNPIVGFNTTAANKIDIVTGVDYTIDGVTHSGKNVYHPAIFTAESPNELYDAGSLGELLKDTHFVTEGDWNDIYNEYIKTIIEQYPFDLWPAEQNELGGIFADRFASTHIDSTTANKTWMAQCKYKYNASSNYNLYIHAKDIISAVNTYTTDNPSAPGIQPGGDFELWLANTERIGGIKAAQDPNTADDCRNIPIVLAGPTVGSVWGLPFGNGTYPGDSDYDTEYLYLPGWALLEWMKNPYFDQQDPQPFISGWKGIDTELRTGSDLIWVGLSGVIPENTGKFCTIQLDNTDPSGATIEWVDLPAGTTYTQGTGITISQQNEISIKTDNALTGQVLTKTADGVDWETPLQGATYTAGAGIEIDENQNNTISQHVERVEIGNPPSQLYVTYTGARDALLINGSSYGITVNSFDFYYNPTATDYTFTLVSNGQQFFSTNPIYFRINANYIELNSDTNYISNITPTNGRFQKGEYFVTIQFGFVKLELINTI